MNPVQKSTEDQNPKHQTPAQQNTRKPHLFTTFLARSRSVLVYPSFIYINTKTMSSTGLRNRKGSSSTAKDKEEKSAGASKIRKVGNLIDGIKLWVGRIITVLQIVAVIFAIYKIIEVDRMVKMKIREIRSEIRSELKAGLMRHQEAMAELRQEWDEGWKRHDVAIDELKLNIQESWEDGWERHQEAMEKLGDLLPDNLFTDFVQDKKEKYSDIKKKLLNRKIKDSS